MSDDVPDVDKPEVQDTEPVVPEAGASLNAGPKPEFHELPQRSLRDWSVWVAAKQCACHRHSSVDDLGCPLGLGSPCILCAQYWCPWF